MLDIRLIRETPELVKNNLSMRKNPENIDRLEKVIAADIKWRDLKKQIDELRQMRNQMASEVKNARKENKNVSEIIEKAKTIPSQIKSIEDEASEIRKNLDQDLMRLPNLLHETVPYGLSDGDNVEVKKWGDNNQPDFELIHHGDLAVKLGIADFDRAVKISGAGFYFLKGELALMEQGLIQEAIKILVGKGYTPVSPPLMMRRKPYEGVTDLSDFEDVMYKVSEDDEYLIATSEHPMAAMHMDETMSITDLPIKYCGISPCFRREIGKHGIDERGLFRVHQFNKIEQFIFCNPEESWNFHEELLTNAEEFMQKLKIPYRVVNVCTGDIGTVASKKYDLEGWSPREGKFIELVSNSNCTSYQATRLNIKYKKGEERNYLHTLNSTMVATARVLRLILENYQESDGSLIVPGILEKYVGKTKIEN